MPYITNSSVNNNRPAQRSQSALAVSAIMNATSKTPQARPPLESAVTSPARDPSPYHNQGSLAPPDRRSLPIVPRVPPQGSAQLMRPLLNNHRSVLSDTPATTAPSSPQIPPKRQNSSDKIRVRPTTLDIPGLTKSTASPDGRISSIDVGSKLVIVMVGLPARGKSYITKKMARYLNWLQHDTRIFNVGERRRVATSGRPSHSEGGDGDRPTRGAVEPEKGTTAVNGIVDHHASVNPALVAAAHLLKERNGDDVVLQETNGTPLGIPELRLPQSAKTDVENKLPEPEAMDQSASFFDPDNRKAALIREQVALETLDELLDYILHGGGSVGILDATNSTLERRSLIVRHVREKAGPDLNVLFIESLCIDTDLLERNMRLKLSGPDYKDKDPEASLEDFKKRVQMYEKSYVPLGEYEESHNIPFVQMVDVGRKIISHQIRGFLSSQAVYYLLNFNLAPRQIWITRHGESQDNAAGKIGGDSELTPRGHEYSKALAAFLSQERKEWEIHEINKKRQAHLSPLPGDTTPPNPHFPPEGDEDHIIQKNFCVWTSMLKRSIQSGQYFDEEEFDVKQMKMLDEINAGYYEGLTYEQIKSRHREEYDMRRQDKLHYRYPGPGGEGYLDVINRLRPVIVELERMTDHVLLIGHRSIARVLLAYFKGLGRDEVTDLDVPIGMVYCLEPKPYGVDFRAYRYNEETNGFELEPNYKLHPAKGHLD